MPAQKSQKSKVTTKSPETGGANARDARVLLLRRKFFDPEVAKWIIGKRENPPSWKAFWEKFVEGK